VGIVTRVSIKIEQQNVPAEGLYLRVFNLGLRISVNVTGHFGNNVTDFFTSVARRLKCNRIGHDAAVSSAFFRRSDSPFITIR
jgi:hypothetical protein